MELLKGFNSSVDFPAAPMTVELFKLNPDAKVILGIRYQSSTWTMGRVHQSLNSRCSDFLPCSENVEICCVQTIRSKRTVHVCSVFGQDELFGRVGHFEIVYWVCSLFGLFAVRAVRQFSELCCPNSPNSRTARPTVRFSVEPAHDS